MNGRLTRLLRSTLAAVLCAAALAVLASCTGDDDGPSSAPSPSQPTGNGATLDAKPVPLKVKVTRVSGTLPKKVRGTLESKVGRAISGYFDAAFVGGEYPRTDFSDAFPTFTRNAAAQARRDTRLLTNAALGGSTESVTVQDSDAWLSVLAPNKVAAGVTAKFRLVFVADRGDAAADREVTMTGRLLLTRARDGGWDIFGYDVARSVAPAQQEGAAS